MNNPGEITLLADKIVFIKIAFSLYNQFLENKFVVIKVIKVLFFLYFVNFLSILHKFLEKIAVFSTSLNCENPHFSIDFSGLQEYNNGVKKITMI